MRATMSTIGCVKNPLKNEEQKARFHACLCRIKLMSIKQRFFTHDLFILSIPFSIMLTSYCPSYILLLKGEQSYEQGYICKD